MPTPTGGTIFFKFTTRAFSTGVATTLSGSPVVSIYKDSSTTESTAGVVLTVDFDSRAGLNHVAIDTSADGTFYSNGSRFWLTITTGTVGGVSAVGYVVGEFDLAAALTTANVTQWNGTNVATPATAGIPDVNVKNINNVAAATPGAAGGIFIAGANAATSITTGLTAHIIGTVDTVTTLTNLPAITSNWLTAAGIAASALNGKGDWLTAAGTLARVTLVDTLTTYTGNTPQTGDSFARIGANGAGLTAVPPLVWDVTLASHVTAGSTGFALNAAGAAGDPWSTSIPGAYGAGTAGFIVGTNLNATISSRSTYAGGAVASVMAPVTVGTNNDKTGYSILLTQVLAAARNVTAVADTSLTLNDALHAAVASIGGQETVVGTTYTTKTSAGTVLRVFTLDSGTAPTSRT